MLAALLLSLAPPVADDPIVIVAQRVAALEINVIRDREGKLHCGLSASSGVARIDDKLCRGAADCVRKIEKKNLPMSMVKTCVATQKEKALAAYRREAGKR